MALFMFVGFLGVWTGKGAQTFPTSYSLFTLHQKSCSNPHEIETWLFFLLFTLFRASMGPVWNNVCCLCRYFSENGKRRIIWFWHLCFRQMQTLRTANTKRWEGNQWEWQTLDAVVHSFLAPTSLNHELLWLVSDSDEASFGLWRQPRQRLTGKSPATMSPASQQLIHLRLLLFLLNRIHHCCCLLDFFQ